MRAHRGMTRRQFVAAGAASGAGLVVGCRILGRSELVAPNPHAAATDTAPLFAPNAWVRIGTDGTVTVLVARSELGQGAMTYTPMLVAEELEVDVATVRVEASPAAPEYFNPQFGRQLTGGSSGVRGSWEPLRRAGAAAREMLIAAAAATWGVDPSSCRAERGTVVHVPSGRRLPYGRLAARAADLPVPGNPPLKDRGEWRVIGRAVHRLDTPAKLRGAAVYGIDVVVPGALVASVERCPVFGGRVARFDAGRSLRVPGVREVVDLGHGVAIVADTCWQASQARGALDITWDRGTNAAANSTAIREAMAAAGDRQGIVARDEGDVTAALARATRRLEAVYEVPFLAHATMEPQNCTAHVQSGRCDVWVGTQHQTAMQDAAMAITGLPREAVYVHTMLSGGGFGRRFEWDFAAEAIRLSQRTGTPVKVIYSREDDIQHDFYRPAVYYRLAAGLDAEGWPVAWTHRIVCASIDARVNPSGYRASARDGALEGAANLRYAIPNIRVDWVREESGVPVGPWRSVAESCNPFAVECFLDEVAAAGGKDLLALRQRLLAARPRHLRVLDLAASRGDWGAPLPQGRGRGIAVQESFGSVVAQVAEVTVTDGRVRVDRVVCAIDCGTALNPDLVAQQMEGGIVFALSAALYGEITIEQGRVRQSNFHDYSLVRFSEAPTVEVHIVPSAERPGGVGEPGVPPLAPAVANAVFAATGRRVRRLPLRLDDTPS